MRSHKFVLTRARLGVAATISALALALPFAAQAQSQGSSLDARWQPWIGCWRPIPPTANGQASYTAPRNSNAPLVCVVPESAENTPSSVRVITIANGKLVAQDTIDANGQSISRSKDHCNGVESASWSADGHRLYVTSDYACPGGLKRTSSGLFAISPAGDWVNVQSVDANGAKRVNTLRYSDAGKPADIPADIAQALNTGGLEVSTARAAAGARLTTADIVEASHKVEPSVVAAWIVDRGQTFNVDANQLIALADAGVPGSVTDAMVAVSYPKSFVVNPPGVGAETSVDSAANTPGADIERSTGRNIEAVMMPAYSPYDYSPFGFAPYGFYDGFGYPGYGYAPYGYAPYGYAPYGYAPYGAYYAPYAGYPLGYGGVYLTRPAPIIVLKGTPAQHGYMVRGHGYTQTIPRPGGTAGTAQPRPSVAPPSPPPPPPPPPSPPSSSSSGRTAHVRP